MKEKIVKLINVDASVGTMGKILIINPPVPQKNSAFKITSSAKPSKSKRRRCSGCSRKRKRG